MLPAIGRTLECKKKGTPPRVNHVRGALCFEAVFPQLVQGGGEYGHITSQVGTKHLGISEEGEIFKGMPSPEDKVLCCPGQSPDLNPAKNLWGDLKRAEHGKCPHNLKDLERF